MGIVICCADYRVILYQIVYYLVFNWLRGIDTIRMKISVLYYSCALRKGTLRLLAALYLNVVVIF